MVLFELPPIIILLLFPVIQGGPGGLGGGSQLEPDERYIGADNVLIDHIYIYINY